jgi:choline dehydrogenase
MPLSQSFDYIIVGSGAAGAVLASRILELEIGSVALIEAGGMPTSRRLKIPVEYPHAFGSQYDWQYETVPQTHLAGRRIGLPAGKALGGSTAINAMIYLRAHADDFAAWQYESDGFWSIEAIDAAYEALERRLQPDPNVGGLHPVVSEVMQIAEQNRFLATNVPFGLVAPEFGIGSFRRCQRDGRRHAAFHEFIRPYLNPLTLKPATPRLSIIQNMTVQHIVFAGERAVAVEATANGTEFRINATRGIILCAGAIQSPRILLASGIGPSEDLKRANIEVKLNNPAVGSNFQDHLVYPVVAKLRDRRSLPRRFCHDERLEYVRHHRGPMASNIAELGGFFALDPVSGRLAFSSSRSARPDFQWHITPTHYLEYPTRESPTDAISFGVTPLHPTSRGRLRLIRQGSSPSSLHQNGTDGLAITIDPNYLNNQRERDEFVQAVLSTREFMFNGPVGAVIEQDLLPGPKRIYEDPIAKSVSRLAATLYHYVGTCAMGPSVGSVVDPRFRVHGIDGLWICDASVISKQLSGNPQATVMMMAWRLAELLAINR